MPHTNWIWKNTITAEEKASAVFLLFRKTITLKEHPQLGHLHISADSRYKLYINKQLVEVGPSKGDAQIWYLDQVDITPYLSQGTNCICVVVLHYPLEHHKGNFGVFRTEHPGLYLEGVIKDTSSGELLLHGDATWKCHLEASRNIVNEAEGFAPLQIYESVIQEPSLIGWLRPDYDDSLWESAKEYTAGSISQAVSPGNLVSRTIPYMYRKKRNFMKTLKASTPENDLLQWDALLSEQCKLNLPAHAKQIVELTAGEEMTGYLHLVMEKGANAKITILQAESYIYDKEETINNLPRKGDRQDYINGTLTGFQDQYMVAGNGSASIPEHYEPFWFRTFRFIKLIIETADAPLTLHSFYYVETGYPLEVKTRVLTSDPDFEQIWNISERSLKRCMHETYEDCPYYEQLQYAMDSRTQILYTYQTAADDRLARKCMDDFRRSQRYDGSLNCCYPSYGPNVIPGFSIFYILMLYDHMMYFGDQALIIEHLPTVERVLGYFHAHLDSRGYVGKLGGLNVKDRYWSFIDWTPEWNATTGVPTATLEGAITMESLLYLLGLQTAEKLADYVDYPDFAGRCHARAEQLKQAILAHCVGSHGLIQDGPGIEQYSQHTQVFAILTDLLPVSIGAKNLELTLKNKSQYVQCSVAMSYYLFRALEKSNLYHYVDSVFDIWRKMVQNHLTTCVEDNIGERSDCHAWGAVALYELPAAILGVTPASPGFATIKMNPQTAFLDYAKGQVITSRGFITVDWKKTKTGIDLHYSLPEGITLVP